MPAEVARDNARSNGLGPSYDEERKTDLPNGTGRQNGEEPERLDKDLVKWDDDDPANPYNWKVPYKAFVTFQLGMLALAASLGSSILSPAQETIAEVMGISEEVAVLNVSCYIIGFCVGPLLWAPLSELWGRRISLIPAMFCLGLFTIGTAVSKRPQDIFITRFFGGLFGSAPVSNVSAAMGDFYKQETRGTAITFYAVMVVGGPTLGPLIGSSILVNPSLGWRWIAYILAIWVFAVSLLALFCLPELYGPVLLARKAKRLRKSKENPNAYHPHDDKSLSPSDIITKHLARPLRMLFTEPTVLSIALYASFVYGLLYMTLEVFPFVYRQQRQWDPVASSLPFLGLFVGVLFAIGINLGNQKRYKRLSRAANGKPVPEARCPPIIVGGFLFCIGLFWFGWTASPDQGVHWSASVVATLFIGSGFNSVFQQCINVLVDTYGIYAASAVSANTFLRSMLAAGFPLVARPMLNRLGVGPAMSILGAVAALLVPVPILLMKYGKELRRRSSFARQLEETGGTG